MLLNVSGLSTQGLLDDHPVILDDYLEYSRSSSNPWFTVQQK